MKKFSFFTLLMICCFVLKSQNPPAPAEPGKENKILIDSLMEVSRYKEFFIKYCDKQIDNAAKVNNWTFEQTRERKLNVNFNAFKNYTVYNWFSRLSREDLLELITIIGRLNKKDSDSGFLITHSGIQSNLELFVKEYVQ
jgi:hypothetical protein